ncbi:OLC1v1009767C3 [Oldenlandia corymbosa var. corymbosa]|uniref:OLC1v1009767C3 n=1 Tax=Oldenlandia corymbosa var. corymbosa TaxID=529605 RepID=A0AAV1DPR4_OLDCO|nr:OLC1v1009767C3 [Oldenlandia corymbosa var. corymbosa]
MTVLDLQLQSKNFKEIAQDQPRVSTESLGTSFSSSSGCSSTFSSVDHGKAIQSRPSPLNQSSSLETPTEMLAQQRGSALHNSQHSSDLRDVVKDSMQREQRGVRVKNAAKEEGRGRTMKHIDSPRPILPFKPGDPRVADIDRSSRLLVKLRENPQISKEDRDGSMRYVRKDLPRFSYDGRETRELYKPTTKLKELPRLSLDSRQSSLKSASASESRLNFLVRELQNGNGTLSQIVNGNQEPGSNKRPSNVVVKLMGLDAFPEYVPHNQEEIIKVSAETIQDPGPRSLKKSGNSKKNPSVFQQDAHRDPASPRSKRASSGMKPTTSPRFPLEIAPWRQPDPNHESPRTSQNSRNATETSTSVYGEIEKRISELEFKKSGKDLRALKQILEAMQNTRKRLEYQGGEQTELKSQTNKFTSEYRDGNPDNSQAPELRRNDANQLALIKGSGSPKRINSSVLITKSARMTDNRKISLASVVTCADASHLQKSGVREILCTREDSVDKYSTNDQTPRKYTGQNPSKSRSLTDKSSNGDILKHTAKGPQLMKVERFTAFGSASPRFQQRKYESEYQSSLTTPAPDLRGKRELGGQCTEKDSSKRKVRQQSASHQSKNKSRSPTDSNNLSIQSDTASTRSDSNCSLASLTETEVTSTDSSTEIKTKHQEGRSERHASVRSSESMPLAQLKIVPNEQPSPVSVLDASFYKEDSPSPVRKISTPFQDYETSNPDEAEWHYLGDENKKKLEKINHLVDKLRMLTTIPDEASMYQVASISQNPTPDHRYITKVLLASGLLKDIGPISTAIQLQSPGNLINPDLFHVLEQTEQSSKSAITDQKQGNASLKFDQKAHRKIVFDTINEILIRKLASHVHLSPRKRIKTGQELLRELCSEVDCLQTTSESTLDDVDESISILNKDMMQQPEEWINNQSEIPAVVLDIERLIFKDLVTEVITAEAFSLSDWSRMQQKCN